VTEEIRDLPNPNSGMSDVDRSGAARGRATIPMHIAVHYIGCAESNAEGIGVPSRAGAFIECLAEAVAQVTVVAFSVPDRPLFEDGVEYTVRNPNASLLSLGPKGTWREYLPRRRRVARIVEPASAEWDVLIFYFLPNRRAHLVYRASRCRRIVGFVVGTTVLGAHSRATLRRRAMSVFARSWTAFQQRQVLRRAGLLVANSEELLHRIRLHPKNVRTVTLSARRARHAFKAADRFRGSEVNLLLAGRITLEKGVLVAVEAFALLKEDLPHARLHVAGEGAALDAMLDRAHELGVGEELVLHGWLPAGDRLFDLYRDMDVLLMPSYGEEGFPQVLWEAMAHSVLVVCTPVRGAREAFQHEHDVLFVPMKDHVAIADAVRRLSNDPELRQRLLSAGFERSRSTSIDDTVNDMLDAITESWPELTRRKNR
jgi:glycosyltransferase involved in cell wall biosynthesis